MIKLYLDDVRDPPDASWTLCRTLDAAKAVLLAGCDVASLDHDLGQCAACGGLLGPFNCPHIGTGYDLVKWMAEHGVWPRTRPTVHSMNPIGAQHMRQMIDRHYRAP